VDSFTIGVYSNRVVVSIAVVVVYLSLSLSLSTLSTLSTLVLGSHVFLSCIWSCLKSVGVWFRITGQSIDLSIFRVYAVYSVDGDNKLLFLYCVKASTSIVYTLWTSIVAVDTYNSKGTETVNSTHLTIVDTYLSGFSVREVAMQLSVSQSLVSKTIRRFGIDGKSSAYPTRTIPDESFIEQSKLGISLAQIALNLNCSRSLVQKVLCRNGIHQKSKLQTFKENERKWTRKRVGVVSHSD
jgi:hypothetical protein